MWTDIRLHMSELMVLSSLYHNKILCGAQFQNMYLPAVHLTNIRIQMAAGVGEEAKTKIKDKREKF